MSWSDSIARGSEFKGVLEALEALGIPYGEIEVVGHFAPDQYGNTVSLRRATFTAIPSEKCKPREFVVEEYLRLVISYDDNETYTVSIEIYEVGHRPNLEARKEEARSEELEAVEG